MSDSDSRAYGHNKDEEDGEEQGQSVERDPWIRPSSFLVCCRIAGWLMGDTITALPQSRGGQEDKWFRLDDDDVTSFDPADIPYQCYGGPGSDGDVHDKSSNGLILFYNKVRPHFGALMEEEEEKEEQEGQDEDGATSKNSDAQKKQGRLVNGYEAYEPEIRQSNLQHILHSYLLDTDLHSFLLRLTRAPSDLGTHSSITFIKFLCNVAFHSRDLVTRTAMRWTPGSTSGNDGQPRLCRLVCGGSIG